MKTSLNTFAILTIVVLPVFGQVRKAATSEELEAGGGKIVRVLEHRMTPAQLKDFLQKRTSCGMMSGSAFVDYASLLWAFSEVGVWSEGTDIGHVRLQNPYFENYHPTWKELMDVMTRQVNCVWHYDHETGYWVFDRAKTNSCFTIKIADGWIRRDEGQRVVFVPPIAPVGMDIYSMGHYSSDDPAKLPEIFTNAIRQVSMSFAKHFKADVADADFISKKVCGESAWFFSAPTPRDPKLQWRQWAFIKNASCFIIVSVISKENEKRLLGDVEQMMSTFDTTGKN